MYLLLVLKLIWYLSINPKLDLPDELKYRHFNINEPPIINNPQTLNYKEIIKVCELKYD